MQPADKDKDKDKEKDKDKDAPKDEASQYLQLARSVKEHQLRSMIRLSCAIVTPLTQNVLALSSVSERPCLSFPRL